MSSEGGSPCSGTSARQGGSTPEALNPFLSPLHLLPQHSPSLDPHPLPSVAWTGTLGARRMLSWAQGLSSWDSPCAELPQLGTALRGNQIFTRGHLAAAGLGEREPSCARAHQWCLWEGAHVGVEGPHLPFPPHHRQPLQEDACGDNRSCRREILSPGTCPADPLCSGLGFWTQQNGHAMGSKGLARCTGVKSWRRGASSEMFCWRL